MKFLKITDQYGKVEVVNPRYIVNIREENDGVRIVFEDSRYSVIASAPTFEEITVQLTGVPIQEELTSC